MSHIIVYVFHTLLFTRNSFFFSVGEEMVPSLEYKVQKVQASSEGSTLPGAS